MRILYFSQFYKPENIAASFRATEHSRIWVRESHDVTVFTGWPNYPVGRLFDGYEVKPLVEELIDGVRVFRSASKIQPNTSFAKRIESGVSFIANGLKNLGKKSPVGSNYDVVLVTCGTVFAAWLGVHYAKKCRLPLVVEFRDLTYKQMLATGSRGAKVAAMKSLELSFCKLQIASLRLPMGLRKTLRRLVFRATVSLLFPMEPMLLHVNTCGMALCVSVTLGLWDYLRTCLRRWST